MRTHHAECLKACLDGKLITRSDYGEMGNCDAPSPPRSVIAFKQTSINNKVSAGVKRRVEIESPDWFTWGLREVARESSFLSVAPARRRIRSGALAREVGWGIDLNLNEPNGSGPSLSLSLPFSDALTFSGDLGEGGGMFESSLPSRSEMRWTEGGLDEPFSSPFLHLKTFDKNEGIAARPVGERPRVERAGLEYPFERMFPPSGVLGGGDEIAGREAGGRG